MRRNWTQEEVDYLRNVWGNVSVKNITKHLSRSVYSILNKVNKLKLGAFLSCGERYVTLSYLSEAVYGNQSSGGYIKISWAQNRGLPLHTICRQKQKFEVVYIDEFWQKDYCTYWDNINGCTANEKDCDSCTSFNRIEPQFCKRCGITFYERKSNDICKDCRAARIKQAQRKYAILNQKRSVI